MFRPENDNHILNNPSGLPVNFTPAMAVSVTANSTVNFQPGILYFGSGGDVVVIPAQQTTPVSFYGIPDGSFLPISVKCFYSVITNASNVVLCY
jgi:hypothetical protein